MTENKFLKYITPSIWVILFCIIAVLPVALMMAKSFMLDGELSFEKYFALFSDTRLLLILFRSIMLALCATGLSLIFGVPFAVFLARSAFHGRKFCSLLYLTPLFIPPHVHALAWIYLCGEKGLLNRSLTWLFMSDTQVFNLYSFTGTTFILFLSYFPLMVLIVMQGLAGMDRRLEESASFLYSPFTVMRKIILPLIAPYILSGAVFVFLFSFFNYGAPSMLRVPTYPGEILTRFSTFYDEGGAAALAAPAIVLALLLLLFQGLYMKNKRYVTVRTGHVASCCQRSPAKSRTISFFMYSVLTASVFLPVYALCLQAETLTSFRVALQGSSHEIITTLLIGAGAATGATILSFFIVRSMEPLDLREKLAFEMFSFMPFAFPATLVGIGLIYLWNTELTGFVYGSFVILLLASLARFLPFALRIISDSLKQIDPGLREAACFCKSGLLKRWRYIDIPLMSRGLIACWVITFIFSTGELGATLLVIPPGSGTLSLKIYTLMHYGAGPLVAALALILISVNFIVSAGLLLPNRMRQI